MSEAQDKESHRFKFFFLSKKEKRKKEAQHFQKMRKQ